jgi:hypothetical protein
MPWPTALGATPRAPELPEFVPREALEMSVLDSTSLDKKLKLIEYTLT